MTRCKTEQIVVTLLRQIEVAIANGKPPRVEDEGEWWETEDTQILTEHLARSQKAIEAELQKTLSA